jgi:hypothetical protein
MPTLSLSVRPRKPLGHRWVIRPAAGSVAVLEIGREWYDIRPLADKGRLVGFRLFKHADASVYDLDVTGADWRCDCPDATFRGRACKHATELREALVEIGRAYALPAVA